MAFLADDGPSFMGSLNPLGSPVVALLFLASVFAFLLARQFGRDERAARLEILEHMRILARCGFPLGPGLRSLSRELAETKARWLPRVRRFLLFVALVGLAILVEDAFIFLVPLILVMATKFLVGVWRAIGTWGSKKPTDILALAESYDATGSLAQAARRSPRIFPRETCELLTIAEERGALPEAVSVIADELASSEVARAHVARSCYYPVVLAAVLLSVTTFLGNLIEPKFQMIGESTGVSVSVEPGLVASWAFVVGLIAILALGALVNRDRFTGKLIARVALRTASLLPVLGPAVRRHRHARWMRRVSAFLEAGATLPEALDAGAASTRGVGSRGLERAALLAREGQPLPVVLGAALSRDARELAAPLLLATSQEGLGPGLAHAAAKLRERSAHRLVTLLDAARPLPMVACAAVVAAHAYVIWGAIFQLENLSMSYVVTQW